MSFDNRLLCLYSECGCNTTGANNFSRCDRMSGQCDCKPGVTSRSCDRCMIQHTNFSGSGCDRKYIYFQGCVGAGGGGGIVVGMDVISILQGGWNCCWYGSDFNFTRGWNCCWFGSDFNFTRRVELLLVWK